MIKAQNLFLANTVLIHVRYLFWAKTMYLYMAKPVLIKAQNFFLAKTVLIHVRYLLWAKTTRSRSSTSLWRTKAIGGAPKLMSQLAKCSISLAFRHAVCFVPINTCGASSGFAVIFSRPAHEPGYSARVESNQDDPTPTRPDPTCGCPASPDPTKLWRPPYRSVPCFG